MIKGTYPYEEEKKVEERDCFPNLKMTPQSLMLFVQRVSTAHLESLGITYEKLLEKGIVFMLSSSATHILKMPSAGEKIKAMTCPCISKGPHMMRETVILGENGDLMAENQASWIMLDPLNGKILRPSAFPFSLPSSEDYEPFTEVWKLKIPQDGEKYEDRRVRLSDLDRNLHMNNTVYASLMTDCIPQEVMERDIKYIKLKYKKQAKLGEVLSLYKKEENGTFFINARADDDLYFQGSITLDK